MCSGPCSATGVNSPQTSPPRLPRRLDIVIESHFLRAPANHFRWRSRQPPGSVGYRWPFRHCDSEHRLSIFELGRRRFGGKPLLHTGSLTNNANPPSRSFWSLSHSVKSNTNLVIRFSLGRVRQRFGSIWAYGFERDGADKRPGLRRFGDLL